MTLPPCFNYEACLSFGLDYRVTTIMIISSSFLVLSLIKGIRHFLKTDSTNNKSSIKCTNCGTYLNGLAWCGNKSCIKFWRETEKEVSFSNFVEIQNQGNK